jgi:hypothetical protein
MSQYGEQMGMRDGAVARVPLPLQADIHTAWSFRTAHLARQSGMTPSVKTAAPTPR